MTSDQPYVLFERKIMMYGVKAAVCVDFGKFNDPEKPSSVHFLLVDRCDAEGEFYLNWDADDLVSRLDFIRQTTYIHRQYFEGCTVAASTTEEYNFLTCECNIPCVLITESELRKYVNHYIQEPYQVPMIPVSHDFINAPSNSYYRAWRIARLLQKFKELIYPTVCASK